MGYTTRSKGGSKAMKAVIRTAVLAGPLVTLTHRAFADLAAECGGDEPAVLWLAELATEANRPIAVNDGHGRSTYFIQPPAWTRERLLGFIAGHVDDLGSVFGEVTGVTR